MKATDIPQADSLSRVRELVQAVQFGAADAQRLQKVMTLHPRHVGYHLHAARILNWLDRQEESIAITEDGEALLATEVGGDAERAIFRSSIEQSPSIQAVAADLLADEPPEQAVLCQRIEEVAGIAPATARRRASTLLRWRTQALPSERPRPAPARPKEPSRASIVSDTLRLARVEVERYGLLRSVKVDLDESAVLIGPNASGKSTLFDAVAFVGDALREGVAAAISRRGDSLADLLWFGEGSFFAIAVELLLPPSLRGEFTRARYEVEIGALEDEPGQTGVRRESLFLMPEREPAPTVIQGAVPRRWRKVLGLTGQSGQARYGGEGGNRKTTTASIGADALALAHLPDDIERFPVAERVAGFFAHGLRRIALEPSAMARPCPKDAPDYLLADGGNLPMVVRMLAAGDIGRCEEWLAHVREALPTIELVKVEDLGDYLELVVGFRGGHEVPARRLGRGVLRILGVTLVPYVAEPDTVYLIEEPENGVHPSAVEAIAQALSWSPENQILVATHSPVWLGLCPLDRLLCVTREAGAARIVPATALLHLEGWSGEVDLPTLFAAGLLS
ncbi:MAG: AAA family ATPase [bacterium]|nr:AAA family ATPase [Myxococcales bacterium]